MSAHVYLAPPASGKTRALIRRARLIMQEDPLVKAWILVPDWPQVQALRRRLAQAGGAFGVELITIGDFYGEILEQAARAYPVAGQPTLHALLRGVVEALYQQGGLAYYSAIRGKAGFINLLAERFAELKRALVQPERLEAFAVHQGTALRELAAIYSAYQARLRELGWADAEGTSWLAVEALSEEPELMSDVGWLGVDGFIEFTPTQRRLLALLAGRVRELVITLPGQEDMSRVVYRRSLRALESLKDELHTEVHFIDAESRLSPPLAVLERDLFRHGTIDAGERNHTPQPRDIYLLEGRGPAIEAREALRWIKALNLREGVPLERTAIYTQEPDMYYPFLMEAAREFGLRVHFSWGERLADAPAAAALVNLLELPQRDYPRRETLDAIRSPYFQMQGLGLERRDADLLELVSLEGQVTGGLDQWRQAFQILASTLAEVPLKRGLETEVGGPGGEYEDEILEAPTLPRGEAIQPLQAAFMALAGRLQPPQHLRLTAWVAWLEDTLEDLSFVQQCETEPLGGIRRLLRGIALSESLTGSQESDYPGFLETLRGGLEGTSLPMERSAPGMILAGRIVEARGVRLDAVAILGLAEGIFPAVEREDPVIDEPARTALGLEPRVGRDQASLFHQALTRADRYLLLTRPYLAEGGEDWQASHYWNAVMQVFPQSALRVKSRAPRRLREAASREEALFWLVRQGNEPQQDLELISRHKYLQHAKQVLDARLGERPQGPYEGYPVPVRASIQSRFGPQHIWSASRLESYGSCPYQFYTAYALGLEPREAPEPGLDAAQLGSLLHRILEEAYRSAQDPDQLQSVLDSLEGIAQEQFAAAPAQYGFRPSALWQAEQDNFLQSLRETVHELAGISAGWTPIAYEQSFGRRGRPPLVIETDQGRVKVAGIIDRLDRDAQGRLRVIDYKTGGSHLSRRDLIEGRRLQLPLYAWAAGEALGLGKPVEGLYWTILAAAAGSLKLASFKYEQYQGLEGALDLARDHVQRIVSGVREAAFPPQPPSGGCPSYCPAAAWCWRYQGGAY